MKPPKASHRLGRQIISILHSRLYHPKNTIRMSAKPPYLLFILFNSLPNIVNELDKFDNIPNIDRGKHVQNFVRMMSG